MKLAFKTLPIAMHETKAVSKEDFPELR